MGNHDIREAAPSARVGPIALARVGVAAPPSSARPEPRRGRRAVWLRRGHLLPPGERIAVADGRGYAILDAVSGRRLVVRTTDAPCHRVFSSSTRSGLRFAVDHSAETFALDLTDGDGIPISRIATPTADPPWQTRQHLVVAFSGDGAGRAPDLRGVGTHRGSSCSTPAPGRRRRPATAPAPFSCRSLSAPTAHGSRRPSKVPSCSASTPRRATG